MRALILASLVSFSALAQDAGVPAVDAPLVTKLPDGSALFNKAAFDTTDKEFARLQKVEQAHKMDPWTPVILGSVGGGMVLGVAVTVILFTVVNANKAK